MLTLPPRPREEAPVPSWRDPVEALLSPVSITMEPLGEVALTPVDTFTPPLEPPVVGPLCSVTPPLGPLPLAPLSRVSLPLLPDLEAPVTTSIKPLRAPGADRIALLIVMSPLDVGPTPDVTLTLPPKPEEDE